MTKKIFEKQHFWPQPEKYSFLMENLGILGAHGDEIMVGSYTNIPVMIRGIQWTYTPNFSPIGKKLPELSHF